MTFKIKTTHTRSCKGEEQYWCQEMRWVPGCRVEEAIRTAQAEQQRKCMEIFKANKLTASHDFARGYNKALSDMADAIAQEDG